MKKEGKKKREFLHFMKCTSLVCLCTVLAGIVSSALLNFYVKWKAEHYILPLDEAAALDEIECILVLGCGVYPDMTPTTMLQERLDKALELYETGVTDRLLMSGDHGEVYYDEVGTMKKYAVEAGVDPDEVFCDHAGFSTYESMIRAREIFGVKRMIIVTQQYHLTRSVYIARALGIEAYGVATETVPHNGDDWRAGREFAARCKDFFYSIFVPDPTYLGDPIDLRGKGSQTDG